MLPIGDMLGPGLPKLNPSRVTYRSVAGSITTQNDDKKPLRLESIEPNSSLLTKGRVEVY
jgi:hypothetical protein